MRRLLYLLPAAAGCVLLGACGYKGPLVRPPAAPPAAASSAAPATAASTTPPAAARSTSAAPANARSS